MIDEQFGADQPCDVCGKLPEDCICPECEKCGEQGNLRCYTLGHLRATRPQIISRSEVRIQLYKDMIADEEMYLDWLKSRDGDGYNDEFTIKTPAWSLK